MLTFIISQQLFAMTGMNGEDEDALRRRRQRRRRQRRQRRRDKGEWRAGSVRGCYYV